MVTLSTEVGADGSTAGGAAARPPPHARHAIATAITIPAGHPRSCTTRSYTSDATEGGGSGPAEPPPSTVTHLNTSGSVAQGEMKAFSLDVIAGRKIVARTTSSVDVDLYVQMGAAPTTGEYLYRGYTDSGNETITLTPASSGKLHIGVHDYAAGNFTLRTAEN